MNLFDECHRLFSYDAETGLLTRKVAILDSWGNPNPMPKCKAGDVVGTNKDGYLKIVINNKQYRAHRLIWLMVNGALPEKQIDHINGVRNDNRWVNLREANHSENGCNRGKQRNNTTGFKGVSPTGRKNKPYEAQIKYKDKKIHLGHFHTAELAHEAYCNKAKELHGNFAKQY